MSKNIVDIDQNTRSEIIQLLREMEMVAATNRGEDFVPSPEYPSYGLIPARLQKQFTATPIPPLALSLTLKLQMPCRKREICFIERLELERGSPPVLPLNMVDKHKLKDLLKETKQTPVDAIQSSCEG